MKFMWTQACQDEFDHQDMHLPFPFMAEQHAPKSFQKNLACTFLVCLFWLRTIIWQIVTFEYDNRLAVLTFTEHRDETEAKAGIAASPNLLVLSSRTACTKIVPKKPQPLDLACSILSHLREICGSIKVTILICWSLLKRRKNQVAMMLVIGQMHK